MNTAVAVPLAALVLVHTLVLVNKPVGRQLVVVGKQVALVADTPSVVAQVNTAVVVPLVVGIQVVGSRTEVV